METLKYLVLENDWELSLRLERYLRENNIESTKIFSAGIRDPEELAEYFMEYDVLIVEPNLIDFYQYDGIIRIFQSLINKDKLKIKQIHFYDNYHIAFELTDTLEASRDILNDVLKHIETYTINRSTHILEKFEI